MSKIRNEDLVLEVSPHIAPDVWDEGRYEAFVEMLCGDRKYQEDAIFTALRFLAGGKYKDLRGLARENFDKNLKFADVYGSWEAMESRLQLPGLLSCSLDLATGTGKSYVLYGVAAILLAEGVVDRVLTLCPSKTIERGLTEKFRGLAADTDLREAMPAGAKYHSPRIINASESITAGCICVENYHAILKHVKSAIRESLSGKGERILVLNDEAHHVASAAADLKKWKEFLLDDEFGFRRVVGVSGTCYVGKNVGKSNDYFADVVSRYSLRQAIEERQVKDVEYVAEAPKLHDPAEKWQLIHQRHKDNVRRLKKHHIRPLTIIVTKDISVCKRVSEDLLGFLQDREKISLEQATRKLLTVTSSPDHQRNIQRLRTVDNPRSGVEWIVSVSMLTEGWDVKNVFQIVPHEERAFNSKLLIAQVLGRGLRIPLGWQGKPPVVTIFNHESWAQKIQNLVKEILEVEKRVSSVVLPGSKHHFSLHNLDYEKNKTATPAAVPSEYNLLQRGRIELPSLFAIEVAPVRYERVGAAGREESLTIKHKTFTAVQIAKAMHKKLASIDKETASNKDPKKRTCYAGRHSLDSLLKFIRESVNFQQIDENEIPDKARQMFLSALGAPLRKGATHVVYHSSARAVIPLNTSDRPKDSCSAAELQRDKTVFYRSDCEKYLPKEQKEFFEKLTDPDGEYPGRAFSLENDNYFKTPVNLAIADSNPERRFMRELCKPENAKKLDAWLKNTAMGFYAVEYAWSKPTTRPRGAPHIKRGMFSPDFFIKQDNCIFVVEIKDDSEIENPSPENIKKYEFAYKHFQRLNKWLRKEKESAHYHFNMLTPRDYGVFFGKLRQKNLERYRSHLDAAIRELGEPDTSAAQFNELDAVMLDTDAYAKEGLKRGERGAIVLVYKENGDRAYEVEFEGWKGHGPFKVKTLKGDEIELVKK